MSGLGAQTLINQERSYYLSSIPNEVTHSSITTDLLLANAAYISTLYSDNIEVSTLRASTLSLTTSDVSGMYVSSLRGNTAFFSSMTLASDLSGGVGYVRFSVDASGIQVDGDPIRFDNLVYLTSTINIVNVSTIVDTDIFAKNGYFSTLSSGNISAGQLQVQQGLFSSLQGDYGSFNRLFVSSLEVLDISGVDGARYWSQYQTLNSTITFQPGNVLSNIGNKLFFVGQELTDASGGGIDWSYFDAQTDVSMNNFSVRGLSTLEYQDGGRLYSQTGNNLFYNGLPVQVGATSNVSQWANYPAVNTIQTGGFPISSIGNLTITAESNVRILADSFSTVADQGLLAPAAYSDINLTAQNGLKGRINLTANPGAAGIFGEVNITANGGTTGGIGTGGLVTINANTPLGFSNATSAVKINAAGVNSYAGAIPSVGSLAGYNFIYGTGGVNICAGIPSIFPNTPLTTFLYGTAGVVSGSDFYTPNIYPYWNGLTTPPDMNITGRYIVPNLAQVYVNLSNVKSMYMDGTAQIQNANYVSTVSTVGQNANFNTGTYGTLAAGAIGASAGLFTTLDAGTISSGTVTSVSTNTSTLRANFTQASTLFYNFALGVSTTVGALQVNNIQIADNITGVTNAPNPLQSRIENFSSIQSGAMSTGDIRLSSINGLNWNDISGGGGGGGVVSSFQNLYTSSFAGYGGFGIKVLAPLLFEGPDAIDNLAVINLNPFAVPALDIGASTILLTANNVLTASLSTTRLQASTFRTVDLSASTLQYVAASGSNLRISSLSGYGGFGIKVNAPLLFSGLDAIDNVAVINLNPDAVPTLAIGASTISLNANNVFTNSMSTQNLQAAYIQTSSITAFPPYTGEIIFDGQLRPLNNIIVLYNNNIIFQDSTGASQFMTAQQLISQEMPCMINPAGAFGCNLGQIAANQFLIGSGTGAFGAAKLYCDFPGDNWGVDIIDANGGFLFETINCYYVPGAGQYQTNLYGVSSITGFTEMGGQPATGFTNIVTAPTISTQNLLVSSINGAPVDANTFDDQFSTLFVSSLYFSTSFSYGSNTGTTYPIFIEKDHAGGATGGDAVAIAVQGHNLGTGAVRNQIEMGARGNGENYIMSVWPGQNLEELFIDATDLTIRDGVFSTIINLDPFGLQTTGGIKGPFVSTLALNLSSINDYDARLAYTNNLQLSTMTLYTASTTLAYWDSTTTSSNINTSGYDVGVGAQGTYKIGFSFQANNTGGNDDMSFFFIKNGVAIPNSATYSLIKNNELITAYAEILEPLNNGDIINVGMYTTGANVQVSTIAGVTPAGDAPAGILTVYKIN